MRPFITKQKSSSISYWSTSLLPSNDKRRSRELKLPMMYAAKCLKFVSQGGQTNAFSQRLSCPTSSCRVSYQFSRAVNARQSIVIPPPLCKELLEKIHDGIKGLPNAEGRLDSPSGGQEFQEIWRFRYTTSRNVPKHKKRDHNL